MHEEPGGLHLALARNFKSSEPRRRLALFFLEVSTVQIHPNSPTQNAHLPWPLSHPIPMNDKAKPESGASKHPNPPKVEAELPIFLQGLFGKVPASGKKFGPGLQLIQRECALHKGIFANSYFHENNKEVDSARALGIAVGHYFAIFFAKFRPFFEEKNREI